MSFLCCLLCLALHSVCKIGPCQSRCSCWAACVHFLLHSSSQSNGWRIPKEVQIMEHLLCQLWCILLLWDSSGRESLWQNVILVQMELRSLSLMQMLTLKVSSYQKYNHQLALPMKIYCHPVLQFRQLKDSRLMRSRSTNVSRLCSANNWSVGVDRRNVLQKTQETADWAESNTRWSTSKQWWVRQKM